MIGTVDRYSKIITDKINATSHNIKIQQQQHLHIGVLTDLI